MNKAPAVGVAALAALMMSGCSSVNTAPDEVALHYSGGPLSDQKFVECVQAGTHDFNGPGEKYYSYPQGQRTFSFSGGQGADSQPIKVVSKDGLEMTVTGIATFNLATADCDKLKAFHEQVGIKYQAYMTDGQTGDGWKNMLDAYLKQPLDRAMDAAALEYNARDLWSKPEIKTAYENKVKELAPTFAREQAGADYFQNLNLTVQKPELPQNIADAISAEQEAILQNKAQLQRNAVANTELEQMEKTKKLLGPGWAVIYQLGKDGKVQVLPVPAGADLAVSPPQ